MTLATSLGGALIGVGFVCVPTTASATAAADDVVDSADASDSGDNQDIIVTGVDDGYRTVVSDSGTKTDTPLLDVPQSIAVVTAQQIADQQIRSVAELVRLTPGLSAGQGEGHRDQISLRGNNSTADFFIDGLRDDAQYFRSFYNIDRVEVHRGPNAMIFGRGGGGGLVNRITKGAQRDTSFIEATGSIDSFASAYGAVDANASLGGGVAARINGFYERLDNHRDAFGGDRYAVNPVIGAEMGNVRAQLGYEYIHDERVVDRGIPSAFAGTLTTPAGPVAGFRDAFFGVRDTNESSLDAHIVTTRLEIDAGGGLILSAQGLFADYDKIYSNAFATGPVRVATSGPLTGQNVVAIAAYRDPTQRRTGIGQVNAVWTGRALGIDHVLLIGGEGTTTDTTNRRINGFFDPVLRSAAALRTDIALANPPVLPTPIFDPAGTASGNRFVRATLDQWSLYIQDQLSFGDTLDIVAGVRYDRFDLAVADLFHATRFERVDDLVSPRFGVIVHPATNASLYASYTRSYLPQAGDQFLNLDLVSSALEPERFDNYEVGAKYDFAGGLSFTAAVFRLDRSNTRAAGLVPGTLVQTGRQRSSGLELGLVGNVTPTWQIALGYARIHARITETTSAAPAGRAVAQVPRHQLSLWNRYAVNDRLGLGLGVYHQSSSFATISNVTRVRAYMRVDAALFYTISDAVDVQLNVENVLGETYFPFAHNDNNISTGAPTNARLTVRVRY
jgi:catecholate siderophore receptor